MQTSQKELNTPVEMVATIVKKEIEKRQIEPEYEFNPNINLSEMCRYANNEEKANDEYLKLLKENEQLLRHDCYFTYYVVVNLMENKQSALQHLKYHIHKQEKLWEDIRLHSVQQEKKNLKKKRKEENLFHQKEP